MNFPVEWGKCYLDACERTIVMKMCSLCVGEEAMLASPAARERGQCQLDFKEYESWNEES